MQAIASARSERRDAAGPAPSTNRRCPRILILPPITALTGEAARLADAFIEDVTVSLARHRSFTIMAHHTGRTLGADPAALSHSACVAEYMVTTALKPTSRGVAMTFRVSDTASDEIVSVSEVDWHPDDLTRVFTHLVGRVVRFIADSVESCALRLSPTSGDVSAYRLYLEGRQSLTSIDLPHLRRAKRWFRDASNRCSSYAAPLFGLARATIMEWLIVGMPDDTSLSEAVALADRGLRHDPFDWRGLREKALASLWLRRHDACLELFDGAMLLGPNDADLIADYADALAHCGEPERGLSLHARAVELNPLHPDYYAWIKGSILFQSGRYEESLEALEPISHNPATSRLLAACSAAAGRTAEARAYACTLREVYPDFRADHLWRVSPNRRARDTAHFVDALRLAGVE